MVPEGRQLVELLLTPQAYHHPVSQIQLLETHISWVILTGSTAYKIKKPMKLDFLDFSTLEKRHQCCDAELRLNRRLAPEIYEAVVGITMADGQVTVGSGPIKDGDPVIECAVRMKQFQQSQLLSHAIETGRLIPDHIDDLAQTVAEFHRRVEIAKQDSPYGTPAAVLHPVEENFCDLRKGGLTLKQIDQVRQLALWSEQAFEELQPRFIERKKQGYIRECHGDMHLGNMILAKGHDGRAVTVFDCIEFNDRFRWIDVISEVAFCVMDLEDRGRQDFAYRFLNAYLQHTGDYSGISVLRFYLVYYAMVRAKVARIRIAQEQEAGEVEPALLEELGAYLELARCYTEHSPPRLIITHGVSGSGKTFGTQELVESLGAVRIRSDVERKRLFHTEADSTEAPGEGLYRASVKEQVYQHLAATAATILEAGYTVIVDATFLNPQDREMFRQLAIEKKVKFHILSFQASDETLRRRVANRQSSGKDASDATLDVLAHQQATSSKWNDGERSHVTEVDSENAAATLTSLFED